MKTFDMTFGERRRRRHCDSSLGILFLWIVARTNRMAFVNAGEVTRSNGGAKYGPDNIAKAKRAMIFTSLSFDSSPPPENVDFVEEIGSQQERALLVTTTTTMPSGETSSICYVAFEGTDFPDVPDLLNNVNLDGTTEVVNGCTFGFPFSNGLRILQDEAGLEEQLLACANSCRNEATGELNAPCEEIIFTGLSKGGGIALAAAAEYDFLNAVIMTFGAAGAVVGPCDQLEPDRIYHFVNTDNILDDGPLSWLFGGGSFCYDSIAIWPSFAGASQVGDFILLSDDHNNLKVIPPPYDPAPPDNTIFDVLPCAWNLHFLRYYVARMEDLNLDVGIDGFDDGTPCGRYDHCNGSGCGSDNTCKDSCDGMDKGAVCDQNPNKYCDLWPEPECKSKRGSGSFCFFHNHVCRSGKCLLFFCL